MTTHLRTLVAGVATLAPDDPALAAAIHLAGRTGAALHLVHVYAVDADDEAGWDPEFWTMASAGPDTHPARLQTRLEAHARALSAWGRTECVALAGDAAEVLTGYAAAVRADLLVLAPTRRPGAAGAVLGTTASRVLRASAVPVLVLREALADRPAHRVLLPTDLSEHSARALPLARELAALLALPGQAVTLPLFVQAQDLDTGAPAAAAEIRCAEEDLQEFLGSIAAMDGLEGTVRLGSPANEILAAAREWDADLVILGTHARRGLPRFFLGSVAETVLRKAPSSALVIPPAAVRVPAGPARERPMPEPWRRQTETGPAHVVPIF